MRSIRLQKLLTTATTPIIPEAAPRSIRVKRIGRLRVNWFVMGAVFGIGASFFMQMLTTTLIVPSYDSVITHLRGAPQPATVMAATPIKRSQAPAAPTYPRNLTLHVTRGDTLVGMLLKNHVPVNEAHEVVNALDNKFNPSQLKIGQKISVTLARHESIGDAAAVKELAIKLPNLSTVELQRLQDGAFSVAAVKAELKDHAYRGYGKVRTSFIQAGHDAGIPSGAMAELIQAFSYDVDFQRDIQKGDTLEVLLDRKETAEGIVGGYGNLRYAALTLRGKKHEIFALKDTTGHLAWYDAAGKSIKKSLLATPINAARITSGFGMRRHPILGYSKMHRGVDFGASQGTPIMAAGDGIVAQRSWVNGYGNFLLIKHNNNYSTAYGHISRFGNIRVGSRVRQGQVVAYVGATGRATGPHLHYEVRLNGAQVSPTARQFNLSNGLTGRQLAQFNATKQSIARELASLAKPASQSAALNTPARLAQR